MISMKYFLYGNGPNCAKVLTRLNIRQIWFDYSFQGYNANHTLCDSAFLNRHFSNQFVSVLVVQGNVLQIDLT
jgi:hypothetical protein